MAVIRRLREDPLGFDPNYWRRGASLGWTALLVAEAHGGGSLTGAGVVDLTLVAGEFGAHAAPGPLLSTNLVAAALNDTGSHTDVLTDLVAGDTVASWSGIRFGADGEPDTAVELQLEANNIVLNGVTSPVEAAQPADHLLVAGAKSPWAQSAARADRSSGRGHDTAEVGRPNPPVLARPIRRSPRLP